MNDIHKHEKIWKKLESVTVTSVAFSCGENLARTCGDCCGDDLWKSLENIVDEDDDDDPIGESF